jgi:RNA polymerase sigma-70 factor, ECF subfamily
MAMPQLVSNASPNDILNVPPPPADSRNRQAVGLSAERIAELLARIGTRDQVAMRELYRGFSRKVYSYALNHIHDPGKAEEIVVDSLYEVWKHPERFRGDSKFSTWLIGIARHKMLDALRSRTPDHDELDEAIPSEDADSFDQLAEKQRRESVRHCMEKLSEDHRECLHLVFYEGMSLSEVAEVQRCPENTVKTRLFHARQKIKNCLRLLLEREH